MSRRNSLEEKRKRRARKLLRQTPTAYIDLVQWIRLREPMTESKALAIIKGGWIRSESHTLTDRYVPVEYRKTLEVRPPK